MKLNYPTALVLAAALAAALCSHAGAALGTVLGAAALTLCGVALAALYAVTRTAHATGRYPAKRKGLAALVLALCLTLGLLPALGGTAYAADSTITWDSVISDNKIYTGMSPNGIENFGTNSDQGISVAWVSGGQIGNGFMGDMINGDTAASMAFTSTVGDISKIVITAQNVVAMGLGEGWTASDSTLTWSGAASNSVTLSWTNTLNVSKISKIEFTIVPSYTVTAADTTTVENKKYQYGDEFTMAVTVSGADFEGGEFTLNYDSNTLEVKTYPTNNKFADSEQTAGSVKFELLNKETLKDGDALATITFKVKAKVTTETTCDFTFSTENPPKICYDTDKDSVEAATVTDGSVTVEPVTYSVTLTPNPSDLTLTGDNGVEGADNAKAIEGHPYAVTIGDYSATDYEYAVTLAVEGTEGTTTLTPSDTGVITVEAAKVTGNLTVTVTRTTKHVTATLDGVTGSTDAIKGVDYTATIGDYDAANYAYTVTLTMNGASATAPTPDTDGKLTITGANITGDFTLKVTKTLANFEVNVYEDYVTGWTLVTIAKASGRTDNPVYNYDGNAAYYVEAYGAYAYLVEGAVTVADATAKVSLGTSAAATIAAGYDVNNTGKVDYSDALLTYRCYEVVHQTPATAMETYLRADVNGSKKVDTTDVSDIDSNRTAESGS